MPHHPIEGEAVKAADDAMNENDMRLKIGVIPARTTRRLTSGMIDYFEGEHYE